MNPWPTNLPMTKPCPQGCGQGMVMEIDPHEVDTVPTARYRCQDCDRREPLSIEFNDTYMVPQRDGRWIHEERKLLHREVLAYEQEDDLELPQ